MVVVVVGVGLGVLVGGVVEEEVAGEHVGHVEVVGAGVGGVCGVGGGVGGVGGGVGWMGVGAHDVLGVFEFDVAAVVGHAVEGVVGAVVEQWVPVEREREREVRHNLFENSLFYFFHLFLFLS